MTRSTATQPRLAEMNYRVVKPLGQGAGSTILEIVDQESSKSYALKVVKRQGPEDDIYIAQAQHEFEVIQRLNHASIIEAYDCQVKRAWFKVSGVETLMELVDGATLDGLQEPDLGQLVLIFIHVASALSHMHRRGVYHGDLKPSNIMLGSNGVVKLIDFGTAWIRGQEKNRVQGTPQYMAPEQATERIVDARTDMYNFGATLYRLLTGQYANMGMPSVGKGGLEGALARARPPIDFNPNIPGTLNETIMQCLQANPSRRPAGMFEIKDQLVAVARYLGLRKSDLKGADV